MSDAKADGLSFEKQPANNRPKWAKEGKTDGYRLC